MGIREKNYWLKQAEAIRRRSIATLAHGIGIGNTDGINREKAMEDLELYQTAAESRAWRTDHIMNIMKVFKPRGHSV